MGAAFAYGSLSQNTLEFLPLQSIKARDTCTLLVKLWLKKNMKTDHKIQDVQLLQGPQQHTSFLRRGGNCVCRKSTFRVVVPTRKSLLKV